jgi:hypothetical protein
MKNIRIPRVIAVGEHIDIMAQPRKTVHQLLRGEVIFCSVFKSLGGSQVKNSHGGQDIIFGYIVTPAPVVILPKTVIPSGAAL